MVNMTETEPQVPPERPRPTLHQYIEENHKLITTLGVFTALTLFARQIPSPQFASILSLLFLTLSMIVWFELFGRFPAKTGTLTLMYFESALGFTVLTLAIYWFLTARAVIPAITIVLTFGAISSLFSALVKRHDLFNRLFRTRPGQRRTLRYIAGIILIAVMAMISIVAATLAATYLDPLLGEPSNWLSQP